MKDIIDEVILKMEDGRKIKVFTSFTDGFALLFASRTLAFGLWFTSFTDDFVLRSEYGGSWTQYGVTKDEMLSPQFWEELWKLLFKWQMVEID